MFKLMTAFNKTHKEPIKRVSSIIAIVASRINETFRQMDRKNTVWGKA
jgi:hypothetical protein